MIYLFEVYFTILLESSEPGSISRYSEKVTGWTARGSVPGRGREIFLFSKASRSAVRFIQSPIE